MKFRVPIDINEATIEHHYGRDRTGKVIPDPTIARVATAVKEVRERCEALAGFADALANDRSVGADAAALRLRDNALKVAEAMAKKLDAAKAAAKAEADELARRISAPPVPRDPFAIGVAAEIRSRLAAMTEKDRNTIVSKALEERDLSIVGAILHAPAMLSGFDKSRQDILRASYRSRWHPEESTRLDRLEKTLAAMDRSGQSFLGYVQRMTTNPTADLAEAAAKHTQIAEQAVLAHVQE